MSVALSSQDSKDNRKHEWLYLFRAFQKLPNYRPQTKFAKVMFLQVSVHTGGGVRGFIRGACVVLFGGVCVVLFGGRAWFYSGACVVLLGGHVWFYSGGMRGFIWGACMVLFGGMCGFIGGACVVLFGGVHGFIRGACMVLFGGAVRGFFSFFGCNQIRSMSRRYASYWNAFLFKNLLI